MTRYITIDSEPVKHLLNVDYRFKVLCQLVGELSYEIPGDPYVFIIETIIGQMLSNKVAEILTKRLISICDSGKLNIASIKKISIENLRSIGLSQRKSQCIIDFTNSYSKKDYSFLSSTDEEVIKKITSIKGLGTWSAKMFLLFVLDRKNILPYEDAAFLQALIWYNGLDSIPSKNEIKKMCEIWSPYISVAARYLYRALDMGLTKNKIAYYMI
jgi:DNA-3-methyladenine glycosylase II